MTSKKNQFNWEVETWNVIDSYFSDKQKLVQHQLDTYNHFVDHKIQEIINEFNPIISYADYNQEIQKYMTEYHVIFGDISISKPVINDNDGEIKVMYPNDARLRNLTYSSVITCDLEQKIIKHDLKGDKSEILELQSFKNINIGKIPIMLRSKYCVLSEPNNNKTLSEMGECEYDEGGYFIVNGSEKVIVSFEKKCDNKVYVFQQSKGPSSTYSHKAEIASVHSNHPAMPKNCYVNLTSKDGNFFGKTIRVTIPSIRADIPLFVLFRALGVVSDKQIIEKTVFDVDDSKSGDLIDLLRPSLEESSPIQTKKIALEYISKYLSTIRIMSKTNQSNKHKLRLVEEILLEEFLPHLGNSPVKKAYFLGLMVRKLLYNYLGYLHYDDRDSFINKRVESPGALLASLFRTNFNKLIKDVKIASDKDIKNGRLDELSASLGKKIKSNTIDINMKYALATGNWGIKNQPAKKGVAQVLGRLSYLASLSHRRRVIAPIERSGKQTGPRKLHNTTWGTCDPCETPEGASIGIVKNLAMMANITIDSNPMAIIECLDEFGMIPLEEADPSDISKFVGVFVNGDWMGIHSEPNELVKKLREMRRQGKINIFSSISWNYKMNQIHLWTDAGRLARPLYIVVDNDVLVTDQMTQKVKKHDLYWDDLLKEGVIEYIDTEESDNSMIAMTYQNLRENSDKNDFFYRYTHCELHPSMILGVLSSNIPFPDHNQCIFEDEPVYMADGTSKAIKDVNVGDEVITFDPKTHAQSYSKIVHTYTGPTNKKIYDVTTFSGRKIRATYDHRFMTSQGWMQLEDIPRVDLANINNNIPLVGIALEPMPMPHICEKKSIILDKESFIAKCYENSIRSAEKYASELEEIGLLPLYNDHPKLGIISRLYGFSLTDAWLGINNKGTVRINSDFGHNSSLKMFVQDFEYLGFRDAHCSFDGRDNGFGNTHRFEKSGAFPAFLTALGRYIGKRTTQEFPEVPSWVMEGSKLVKREFLAGFQGGDGCKIRWNRPNNRGIGFVIAKTLRLTTLENKDSMERFMEQCKNLLSSFGINVKMIPIKIKDDRAHVCYKISNERKNLISYFDQIGYRYDVQKNMESGKVVEYLRYLEKLQKEREETVKKIRVMRISDPPMQIAEKLNMDVKKVRNYLKLDGKNIGLPLLAEHQSIEKWMNIVNTSESFSTIFVPLYEKKEAENVIIADITTESKNMSFISGEGFCVHNSPRNLFQGAMGKQGMGIYATNFNRRMDTIGHIMHYPQKPLVNTQPSAYVNSNELPSGQNPIIAVACYTGYNQEDSIIMNADSVERGLFNASSYRTYKDEEKKNQSTLEEERFCKPVKFNPNNTLKTRGMKHGSYEKLDETGFVKVGSEVEAEDIIIGKVIPLKTVSANEPKFKDASTTIKANESGVVDWVYTNKNGDGYRFCKVRVRSERVPEIADKFACYSEDTEILTENRGWIYFIDLTKKDKVATLVDGNYLKYEHPTETFEYDYDGKMYELTSNHINLCVTPNHRMYVGKNGIKQFELDLAENIFGKKVRYKKNATYIPENEVTKFILPAYNKFVEKEVDLTQWLIFLGLWMTEGSLDHTREIVKIYIHKKRVLEKLDKCCEKLNFKYYYDECSHRYTFRNKQLYNYLKPFGKSINKYLPDFVWKLNIEQTKILIESLLCGDGGKDGKLTTDYFYTSSTQLADDFQRLCLHAGYSANKMLKRKKGEKLKIKGIETIRNADHWTITFIKAYNNQPLVSGTSKTQTEQWIEYTGKVYCCTVSSGVIYVRRNGKPVWSGNSRHGQLGQ